MTTGAVRELWRYPVKSMAGERLRDTHVDATGLVGDRAHALTHEHKGATKALTAREAPRLLAWSARYPDAPDGGPQAADVPPATVVAPDGTALSWGDPRLGARLADDLGRPVGLRRAPDGALHDLPRTMLVTTEATRRALEGEMGEPVDLRRFRTNVHLDVDAAPWDDLAWEGGTLVFAGGVRLRLLHPCERCVIPTIDPRTRAKWPALLRHLNREHETCFGINAQVITAGRLAIGDTVALELPVGAGGADRLP